jgi:predicted RNase H-like HicB family nuclease
MARYTVRYERDIDSGWWVAQVKEVPAAITQGRTIAQARERIREALGLALDDDRAAGKAVLVEDVALPGPARKALQGARKARERLAAEGERARGLTAEAVTLLTRQLGLSRRDVAELLGISFQRVQQLSHKGA